jgi:hypothetical protein
MEFGYSAACPGSCTSDSISDNYSRLPGFRISPEIKNFRGVHRALPVAMVRITGDE